MYENVTVQMMMQGMSAVDIRDLLRSGLAACDLNRIGPAIEMLATRGDTDMVHQALVEAKEFDLTQASTVGLSGCLVRIKKVDPYLGWFGKLLCRTQTLFMSGKWRGTHFRISDLYAAMAILNKIHPEMRERGTDELIEKQAQKLWENGELDEEPTVDQLLIANMARKLSEAMFGPVPVYPKTDSVNLAPMERAMAENMEKILERCSELVRLAEQLAKKPFSSVNPAALLSRKFDID